MKNKKLKNLIELSSNVKIYVPSTIDVDKTIDTAQYVDNTLKKLSKAFGGATSYNALGCWESAEKGLIKEHIIVCESFCSQSQLEREIDNIIEYCEDLKRVLKQEAISLEVNNKLYFV